MAARSRLARLLLVLAAAALGCAARGSRTPVEPAAPGSSHGYALLYQLLGQEKDVSKLLLVKVEGDRLEQVIDAISETCGDAHDRLEELAGAPPRLDLADTGLPAAEMRARELTADDQRDQLLSASGRDFELRLLLAQNQALGYASHLTDALSRSEPDPARLAYLRQLWKDLTRLHAEVLELLRQASSASG
jgi:hypothetical protein